MGLGAEAFMLVRLGQTGEVFVLDYRERARGHRGYVRQSPRKAGTKDRP